MLNVLAACHVFCLPTYLIVTPHSEDGWLTARQSKVRRVESPAASEEGMSEGSTPPDVLSYHEPTDYMF